MPRALTLASPKRDEREVGLELLARCTRHGGDTLVADKGSAGRAFASAVDTLGAEIVRPTRRDEPGHGPHLAPIRQRIESIFWTCKDILTLKRHGASEDDISVAWVPGAFEIPLAAQKMARAQKPDAVICLGTVIRGSTPHFDFIASEAAKGVAKVSLDSGLPVIFGVITADTIEQAVERAGSKDGNKGRDAALSAIEMVDVLSKIK